MVTGELARLQRFRRVAQNHKIGPPEQDMNAEAEIEHLREHLNASVYLKAEDWMLPSWVALTLKGLDKEKTLITELPNNSYRNWFLIGGVGSTRHGITDSRGLSMIIPDCGSIDFWILGTDGIVFPALMGKDRSQLRLVSTEDQLYEWKMDIQSVDFTRLVYHVEQDGVEYIFNEVVLKNIALEESTITFFAVLRPMSTLGVEAIESIEFDVKTNRIFANNLIALKVDMAPSAVYLVEANNPDVPEIIQSEESHYDYKIFSELGLGSAILKFNITLPPAGNKTIVFASPLEPLSERESLMDFVPDRNSRDRSVGCWYDFAKKRGEAFFPDERLDSVLAQAVASLAIQVNSTLNPSSLYSWDEKARILFALLKAGGSDVASQIMHRVIQQLRTSDLSLDISMLSPLLWSLLKMQRYSLQRESIQEINSFIVQLTEKLLTALLAHQPREKLDRDRIEQTSTDGLEDMPLEHYRILSESMLKELNESLWALASLQESLPYFSLTDVTLSSKIKNLLPFAENLVQERFNQIQTSRWPREQDPQMYDIDRSILHLLTSIVQLRLDLFDNAFIRSLCMGITKRRVVRNLWKIRGPPEFISSHLALRIAQFHVWDKQRDAAEPFLRRALEFLSEDYLLPEFVNPRTFGGSGGAGSSVLAAVDITLLLCDMLVHEDKDNLVFLSGIPSDWYEAKRSLSINGLRTKFGKTHIDIGLSANQHQIETGMENLPEEIEIHVPETVPLRMVKVYGASIINRIMKGQSPHLKLIPLSNEVVLTYHR